MNPGDSNRHYANTILNKSEADRATISPAPESGLLERFYREIADNRVWRYQILTDVPQTRAKQIHRKSRQTAKPGRAAATRRESGDEQEALFNAVDRETKPIRESSARKPRPSKSFDGKKTKPWGVWVGAGWAALLLLGVVLFVRVGDQTVKIEIDDPNAQVFVDGDEVQIMNLGAVVHLKPGEHNLEVRRGDVVVQTDDFEILRGENPILKIRLVKSSEGQPRGEEVAKTNGQKRFLDRGEYLEDTKTGLFWQKDGDASGKLNFYQAADYAEKLKLAALTEWRVPTRKELAEIFPAVESPFRDTKYTEAECCTGPHEWNSYWTSDLDIRKDDYAYLYHWYAKGGANNAYASKNFVYVRCVHDPVQDNLTKAAEPESDRDVAEWIFKHGGSLAYVTQPGKGGHYISSAKRLPDGEFFLYDVTLVEGTPVTREDMQRLMQLPRLIVLKMPRCQITDEHLQRIQSHPKMFSLDLSGNPITDAGIQFLNELNNLKHLKLNGTQITAQGVAGLKDLPELTDLEIGDTKISDATIDPIIQMSRIDTLNLGGTAITDGSIPKLKTMANLWGLSLERTQITDAAIEMLGGHPKLHRLVLTETKITDAGLAHLAKLPELISLNISGCKVTNQGIIDHIAELDRLSELYLFDTPLTDAGLNVLGKLPNLRILQFDETKVTREGMKAYQETRLKRNRQPGA